MESVGSVVLVSGCPGSGKTTLSRTLAESHTKGLHLVSDHFYEFIAHVIDPATPESQEQNFTIMRALGACAAQFAQGGYTVFLDGVIGPWMLPKLRPFLEPIGSTRYVVLQVPLTEALARVESRQGPGLSPTVVHMHEAFGTLGPHQRFAIETSELSPFDVAQRASSLLAEGELQLDWSSVGD